MEKHGCMISTGENSCFVHQGSLAILPAEPSSSEVGGNCDGNYEFLPYGLSLSTSKISLTCRKILRFYEAHGFTFPPKEGVLRIYIALKYPFPSTGVEPAKLWFNGKHVNQ
jgi:hypothetical protein